MAFDLNKYLLFGFMADVSTAGQIYIPIPKGGSGKIAKITSIINGVIATADVDFTAKINAVAVTGGLITATASGSGAGDIDTAEPTALNDVVEGASMEIETDGASTNTVSAFFLVEIIR